MIKQNRSSCPVFLGIEAGGTRTVALAVCNGEPVRRLETGPANVRLVGDRELVRHFAEIGREMPQPFSIAIGMAGARAESDRERIRRAAARTWPSVPCHATNDLETALMADAGQRRKDRTRVLVLSGTGSCCFGHTPDGKTAKVGGWGHILGDKASGYEIGLRGLKAVVYYYDRDGRLSPLGQRILRSLQFNEPDDLIGWALSASKTDIASLALEVFTGASKGEKIPVDILKGAACSLARDAAACATRLCKRGTPVEFVLAGSVLLKQPRFARQVGRELRRFWPAAVVAQLRTESVWGAVELARRLSDGRLAAEGAGSSPSPREGRAGRGAQPHLITHQSHPETPSSPRPSPPSAGGDYSQGAHQEREMLREIVLSPTEQRNPRSMNLDKLPLGKAIALMLNEDARIPAAIHRERPKIERAIQMIVQAFKRGGRLFYVGAGTSGRLGVLDASECPPTFRTKPEMVQGIIAGGQRALWEAVEGAEDDPDAGARAAANRGVRASDVVVGIAASGRTPFVWGALEEAKRRGAKTVLLCFNPNVRIPPQNRPDLILAPNVGPEILTGSTRLKAGTATKLILNILTTLAMVRTGKVLSNLMIDVKASNTKLRDRATRIVQQLTGADYETSRTALEKADWQIKAAASNLTDETPGQNTKRMTILPFPSDGRGPG